MLESMVATSGLDLIVALGWVGALTLILLARALVSWRRFRRTAAFAAQSRRLSEATGSVAASPHPVGPPADVIPFRTRTVSPAPSPAERQSQI
jgi:hypothetical protein